jgi:hypothetical protein
MNIKTLLLFVHSHHYNSINPTIVNVFKVLELAHFVKNHFVKNHFVKNHFVKNHFVKNYFFKNHFVKNHFVKNHFVKNYFFKNNFVKIQKSLFQKPKRTLKNQWWITLLNVPIALLPPRPEGRLRDWVR